MPEFKSTKTAVFFVLSLLVAIAGIFGFAEFTLSTEASELILSVVAIVSSIVGFYNQLKR